MNFFGIGRLRTTEELILEVIRNIFWLFWISLVYYSILYEISNDAAASAFVF